MKKTALIIYLILAPLILAAQGEKKHSAIPEQLNKLMITENIITRFYVDSVQEAKDEVNEAKQKELDEINKAVEELKKEYDKVIMDEYVEPIEEINENEGDKEDICALHSGEPETNEK